MVTVDSAEASTVSVQEWADLSENRFVFRQPESELQPSFDANGLAPGVPSVRFDLADAPTAIRKFMKTPEEVANSPTEDITVLAKVLPLSEHGVILSQGFEHRSSGTGWLVARGTYIGQNSDPNTAAFASHDGSSTTSTDEALGIWVASKRGSSSAGHVQIVAVRKRGHDVRVYIDGRLVAEHTQTAAGISYACAVECRSLRVGGVADTRDAQSPFVGHVGEVLVWARALTDTEFQDANRHLDPRLFLVVAPLPPQHFFQISPPDGPSLEFNDGDWARHARDSPSGSTVMFLPGLYSGGCGLYLEGKDLILTSWGGPEATVLDCGGASRHMHIVAGNVTVRGLSLVNGKDVTGEGGGCVLVDGGASLRVDWSVMRGCDTAGHGGAIRVARGHLLLTNGSRLTQSTARGAGGGVALEAATCDVAQSVIDVCNAYGRGGGIDVVHSRLRLSHAVRVVGCRGGSGGGVAAEGSEVTMSGGVEVVECSADAIDWTRRCGDAACRATQSSTIRGGFAWLALDGEGYSAEEQAADTCIHTDLCDGLGPACWWRVDLGQAREIARLRIENRRSHLSRLRGFEVWTSHAPADTLANVSRCYQDTTPESKMMPPTLNVPCATVARYVWISVQNDYLNLCEVHVYAPRSDAGRGLLTGGAVLLTGSSTLTASLNVTISGVAQLGGGAVAAAGSSQVDLEDGVTIANGAAGLRGGGVLLEESSDMRAGEGVEFNDCMAGNGGAVYLSGHSSMSAHGVRFAGNVAGAAPFARFQPSWTDRIEQGTDWTKTCGGSSCATDTLSASSGAAAVDGDAGSCLITATDATAWWKVDLGQSRSLGFLKMRIPQLSLPFRFRVHVASTDDLALAVVCHDEVVVSSAVKTTTGSVAGAVYRTCSERGGIQDPASWKCFFIPAGATPAAWRDARSVCVAEGGDLASVTSVRDNELVTQLAGSAQVWIGLTDDSSLVDDASAEHFRWSDGSTSGFLSWEASFPRTNAFRTCVSFSEGLWQNVWCDLEFQVACAAPSRPPFSDEFLPTCEATGRFVWVSVANTQLQLCEVEVHPPLTGAGGAVDVRKSSTVSLVESHVVNNLARDGGGLSATADAIISLASTVFANNQATEAGGACMVALGSQLVGSNVDFYSNIAESGGAMFIDQGSVDLAVCSVHRSVATTGGAVTLQSGTLLVQGPASFVDNVAMDSGGSIFANSHSRVSMSEIIRFIGNLAVEGTGGCLVLSSKSKLIAGSDVAFLDCHAPAGGALHVRDRSVAALSGNVFISGATANKGDGGAVLLSDQSALFANGGVHFLDSLAHNGGSVYADSSYVYLGDRVGIVGGCAEMHGGGVRLVNSVLLAEHHVSWSQCSAERGGALSASRSSVRLRHDVRVELCSATDDGGGVWLSDESVLQAAADMRLQSNWARSGGCLYCEAASNVSLENGVALTDCRAVAEGGGAFVSGGSHFSAADNVTWHGCHAGSGGALRVTLQSEVRLRDGIRVHHCTAAEQGAVVHSDFARLTIHGDVELAACHAPRGGVLSASQSTVSLRGTRVKNIHDVSEGAIFATASTVLELNNVTASNCSSLGRGGFAAASDFSSVSVIDSIFTGIHSADSGGVFFMDQTAAILHSSYFLDCSSSMHGGVVATNALLDIAMCTFVNCSASDKGGAVLSARRAPTLIRSSRFERTRSGTDGGAVKTEGSIEIESTLFHKCMAGASGGAVRVSAIFQELDPAQVVVNVSRSLLQECVCSEDGGAISTLNAELRVSHSMFVSGVADIEGGAIHARGGTIAVSDSAFKRNAAGRLGGAVSIRDADLSVVRAALTENVARGRGGGAVSVVDSSSTLDEIYAQGNSAENGGGGVLFWKGAHPPLVGRYVGGMCGAADGVWEAMWQPCSPGTTGAGGATCAPCPEGTYKNDFGSGKCTTCPLFSTSMIGSSSADDCRCVVGTVLVLDKCVPCPAGTRWLPGGASNPECVACYGGTYQDESAATSCKTCSDGQHSPIGSQHAEDCFCSAGSFNSKACDAKVESCLGVFAGLPGIDYRGCEWKTVSGRTCQRWDSQYPHVHEFVPALYPDAGLQENYCRNPDGDADGIWCVTDDPDMLRESCFASDCYTCFNGVVTHNGQIVEDCRDEASTCRCQSCDPSPECSAGSESNGNAYRGCRTQTRGGIPCQRWDSQYPHTHTRSPEQYPTEGLVGNFCRNPDGFFSPENRDPIPWCFTTDPAVRWDYCFDSNWESSCEQDIESNLECFEGILESHNKKDCRLERAECKCKRCDPAPSCESGVEGAMKYRGCRMHTKSGFECQRWDAQSPQRHTFTQANYPDSGLLGAYCRSPDGSPSPWCYIKDDAAALSWDYCFAFEDAEWATSCHQEALALHNSTSAHTSDPVCVPCLAGTFQTGAGCVKCPQFSTSSLGSSSVFDCVCWAGYGGPAGGPCSACPAGTFKNFVGEGECLPCAQGSYQPESGSTFCFNCPVPNAISRNGSTSILDCECQAGFVGSGLHCGDSVLNGDEERVDCGGTCAACCNAANDCDGWVRDQYRGCQSRTMSGRVCQEWRLDSPHPHVYHFLDSEHNFCREGGSSWPWCFTTDSTVRWDWCIPECDLEQVRQQESFFNRTVEPLGSCKMCKEGSIGTVIGKRTACEPCPENTQDCLCNAGYTGPREGPCVSCGPGTYKPAAGTAECATCEPGKVAEGNGSTLCEICPAGTYLDEGIGLPSACASCPEGSWRANEVWSLVFRQNAPFLFTPNTVKSWNPDDPESPNFSKLNMLEDHRLHDGKFHFKLHYPLDHLTNEWNQVDNPVSMDARSDIHSVEGYDAVSVDFSGAGWGGLKQSGHNRSFLDGSISHSDWFFAVGAYEQWDAGFPGMGQAATLVELYVLSPANEAKCNCNAGYSGPNAGQCKPCAAGKYKAARGSGVCLDCPAGTVNHVAGAETCWPCPAGTFHNATSSVASCVVCPNHSSSPAASHMAINCSCDAGFQGLDGGICMECTAGTYKEARGSQPCIFCPPITSSPAQSTQQSQCVCNAGYEGPPGGPCLPACGAGNVRGADGDCRPCPGGTFKNPATAKCTACAQLATSPIASNDVADCVCVTGAQGDARNGSCSACPLSFYKHEVANGLCRPCPRHASAEPGSATCACNAGYSGEDECSPCSPGYYKATVENGSCAPCRPGTYSALPASTQCSVCQIGEYSTQFQATSCALCAGNTSATVDRLQCTCNAGFELTGDGTCEPCPQGTTGINGSCVPCPAGLFSDRRGSTTCSVCPAGKFGGLATSPTSCAQCPDHISLEASVSETNCMPCRPGTYSPSAGSGACLPCPRGHFTAGAGASGCFGCAAGQYHVGNASSSECHACPPHSWSTAGSSGLEGCLCKPGFFRTSGGTCKACDSGWFKVAEGPRPCQPCPANSTSRPAASSLSHCLCNVGFTGSSSGACVACELPSLQCNSADYGACEASTFAELLYDIPSSIRAGEMFSIEVRKLDVYNQVLNDASSTLQVYSTMPDSSAVDPTVAVLGSPISRVQDRVFRFTVAISPTFTGLDVANKTIQLFREPHVRFEGVDIQDGGTMKSSIIQVHLQSGDSVCKAGYILDLHDLQQNNHGEQTFQGECKFCQPGTYSLHPLRGVQRMDTGVRLPACIACPEGGDCVKGGADVSFRVGEWVDVGGQYELIRCPIGHKMRNKPHDLQACQPCAADQFIFASDDSSFQCQSCPRGFTCPDGGPPSAAATVHGDLVLLVLSGTAAGNLTRSLLEGAFVHALVDSMEGLEAESVEVWLSCSSLAACEDPGLRVARRSTAAQVVPFVMSSSAASAEELERAVEAETFVKGITRQLAQSGAQVTARVQSVQVVGGAGTEFEVQGGVLVLTGCSPGHVLVNSPVEVQQCNLCPPLTYSIDPHDGCAEEDGALVCRERDCMTCPDGAECLSSGDSFTPQVENSIWVVEQTTDAEGRVWRLRRLVSCPPGSVLVRNENPDRDQCIVCPRNTYLVVEATFSPPMLHVQMAEDATTLCEPCNPNAVCLGGNLLQPNAGYWLLPEDRAKVNESRAGSDEKSIAVYRCPIKSCETGGVCVKGKHGPLCGLCKPGFGRSGSSCIECGKLSDPTTRQVTVVGVVVLLLAVYYLAVWRAYFNTEQRDEDSEEEPGSWLQRKLQPWKDFFYRWTFRLVEGNAINYLKIMISFCQVVSVYEATYAIEWPAALTTLWSVAAFLRLDLARLPGAGCLSSDWSYAEMQKIFVISPLVVTVLLALPSLLARVRHGTGSACLKRVVDAFWYSIMFWWFLSWPVLASMAVDCWSCEAVGPERFLTSDLSVPCPMDNKDGEVFAWAVIATALYPVGVPIFLYLAMLYYGVAAIARRSRENAILGQMLERYRHLTSHTVVAKIAGYLGGASDEVLRRRAWEMFDGARQGDTTVQSITFGMLLTFLGNMGLEGGHESELQELMHQFDDDSNGMLEWPEFLVMAKELVRLSAVITGEEHRDDLDDERLNILVAVRWEELLPTAIEDEGSRFQRELKKSLFKRNHSQHGPPTNQTAHHSFTDHSGSSKRLPAAESPIGERPPKSASVEEKVEWLLSWGKELLFRGLIAVPVLRYLGESDAERLAMDRVGMLFDCYALNFWYFELIEMARKFVMTSCVAFLYPGSAHQVAAGLFVANAHLVFFVSARPYLSATINRAQTLSLVAQSATLFYGLMLSIDQMNQVSGRSEQVFLVYFMAALNGVVFFLPLFAVLADPLKRRAVLKKMHDGFSALSVGSNTRQHQHEHAAAHSGPGGTVHAQGNSARVTIDTEQPIRIHTMMGYELMEQPNRDSLAASETGTGVPPPREPIDTVQARIIPLSAHQRPCPSTITISQPASLCNLQQNLSSMQHSTMANEAEAAAGVTSLSRETGCSSVQEASSEDHAHGREGVQAGTIVQITDVALSITPRGARLSCDM